MKQEIGSSITVDGYRVKFLKCLTPLAVSTDADINVYECECEDGHREAVASDNASCWLIGDEDDHERNREQFLAIHKANGNAVEWESINDPTLKEWILARIDEVIDLEDWVVCDEEEWCNWAMLFRRDEVPTKYEFAVDAGFDEPERFLNDEHLPTISLKEYVKSCDGRTTNLVRDTAEEEMAVEKAVKEYKEENAVYTVEHARGAKAEAGRYEDADWSFVSDEHSLENAREVIKTALHSLLDREDRGEEYEQGWLKAIAEAEKMGQSDVVGFDERYWVITFA